MKKIFMIMIVMIFAMTTLLSAQVQYEMQKILASDGTYVDYFGYSVFIYGDYVLIGSHWDDDAGSYSGSAYIFYYDGTSWSQQAKLTASDAAELDYFAYSVSISGDYAVAGAYRNDDHGPGSGSAYIYEKPSAGWSDMTETVELHASDPAGGEHFGFSVSIDGDYALIGANQDGEYGHKSGAAYIFIRISNDWLEKAKLHASDATAEAYFGSSVSINGDYAVIGGYIFEKPTTGWSNMTERAKLTPSGPTGGFGKSVSINGDFILVGAYKDDDNGYDSGAAFLFYTDPIIGDFNFDGYVDPTDLQMFGDHWHFVDTDPGWDSLYDLVLDGIIDAADLQVFGNHWHEGTPPKYGSGKSGKGPNEFAGIVFDLDTTTYGNQNLTNIPTPNVNDYIRVDVYCTGVHNLDTYGFEVLYNTSHLEYVTATATNPITFEPNILTTNGGTALGWMVDTSTPGVLSIAYTLAYADTNEAPEGEGLIADIVFKALTTEQDIPTLTFGDVRFYDTFGEMDNITDKGTATFSTLSPDPPENVNIEIVADGDSVKISWDNEGYVYHVYSNDNPYSTFPGDWVLEATVNNVGEVTIPAPAGNKKFYIITADNAKGKD